MLIPYYNGASNNERAIDSTTRQTLRDIHLGAASRMTPSITHAGGKTRLLIRLTELDDRSLAFAEQLQTASGCPLSFVVDATRNTRRPDGIELIELSAPACERIGLYCPDDFAWRCGDYGYHVARQQYPGTGHFWMIEYDVRLAGEGIADFFDFFAQQPQVDLLVSELRTADLAWHWTRSVKSRNAVPQRCFFPVSRLSAQAVDAVYRKRVEHAGSLRHRLNWPNDEAMVATTLVNGGFDCRDINSFGPVFYAEHDYSFHRPIDGDTADFSQGSVRLRHPVLYGEHYRSKVSRLSLPELETPFLERLASKVNSLLPW